MKKILLVEDEAFIADMYKMKFIKEGYDITVAGDGESALELVKEKKPDLILLDLVLPKMNGFQVLEKLKQDNDTKNIKVFILSNLGQSGEIDQGYKEGADGYLIKSNLTPSQLIENIEKIFKGEAISGVKKSETQNGAAQKNTTIAKTSPVKKENVKGGQKILLIEDEEAIAQIYKLAFENSGYVVDVAKNGAWGVKLSGQNAYDAIIMDMVMPAMSGYEALKKIKENENAKKLPVIILSNSAQDNDIKKAMKLGAASFLLKALITPAKIVAEVRRLI
jgi:CheY-like chemotaxis protein